MLLRSWVTLVAGLCLTGAALAAKVVGTAPADIGRSLRDDGVTVVLFWSPDPRCGYCLKEDKVFDALAKGYDDNVVFRRVQWSPWTAFPSFDLDIRLKGVPQLYVFRGRQATAYLGRQIAGDAAWVKTQIDHAVAGRLLPLFGTWPAPKADPPAPKTSPTPEDLEAVKGLVLSSLLERGTLQCSDLNARLAQPLAGALAQWRARHRVPALTQVSPFVDRVGTATAERMLVDADKVLAGQLEPNDASLAGCSALVERLRKDPP